MSTIPGVSDHDAIVADCDIRPEFCKKKPRMIFFSKAYWSQMKVDMNNFTPTFLAAYLNCSVEENWSSFKEHLSVLMSTYIASKTTSKRQNLPWMSAEQCRKSR